MHANDGAREFSRFERLTLWLFPGLRFQVQRDEALIRALHETAQAFGTLTQWTMAMDERLARIEERIV